jgi:hypothetical protein
MFYLDEEGLDGWRGKNGPKRRIWCCLGPRYFFFITTTPSARPHPALLTRTGTRTLRPCDTPASAHPTPLACKCEPEVGFSSSNPPPSSFANASQGLVYSQPPSPPLARKYEPGVVYTLACTDSKIPSNANAHASNTNISNPSTMPAAPAPAPAPPPPTPTPPMPAPAVSPTRWQRQQRRRRGANAS